MLKGFTAQETEQAYSRYASSASRWETVRNVSRHWQD